MQIFRKYVLRVGNAHYYWDGSGRLRDLGRMSLGELRQFMQREQVPLMDQKVIFPPPPDVPVSRSEVTGHDRKIVGRY